MVKRVYLHIGRHKTGTTAIQYALDHAPEALGEAGFVYPLASSSSDHAYLARWLNPVLMKNSAPADVESARQAVEQLLSYLQNIDRNVILSSEGLQDVPPENLIKMFSEYDVKIIMYLREQAVYLASAYQQDVKAGIESHDFVKWVLKFLPPAICSYSLWLDEWISVFGEENVILRVYDRDLMADGDILTDFLSIFEIDPAPFKEIITTDANPSIKGALLEAKRRMNLLGYNINELHHATYGALRDLPNQMAQYRGLIDCDPEVIKTLREQYVKDNRKISEKYFGRSELFPLRPFPNEPPPAEDAVKAATNLIVERIRRENPAFADDLVSRLEKAENVARPA